MSVDMPGVNAPLDLSLPKELIEKLDDVMKLLAAQGCEMAGVIVFASAFTTFISKVHFETVEAEVQFDERIVNYFTRELHRLRAKALAEQAPPQVH
jgi:hypothetical protein